jgi:hypothetical protein
MNPGTKLSQWEALVELRAEGSIGQFQETLRTVQAKDQTEAIKFLLEDAWIDGLEPRFVKKLKRIS